MDLITIKTDHEHTNQAFIFSYFRSTLSFSCIQIVFFFAKSKLWISKTQHEVKPNKITRGFSACRSPVQHIMGVSIIFNTPIADLWGVSIVMGDPQMVGFFHGRSY